jgi:hypothetical protein
LLKDNRIGAAGAEALSASPHFSSLTSLILENNGIGDEGAKALAATPNLPRLYLLDLSGNNIGNEGGAALAASPHFAHLVSLNLTQNPITGEAPAQLKKRFGELVCFLMRAVSRLLVHKFSLDPTSEVSHLFTAISTTGRAVVLGCGTCYTETRGSPSTHISNTLSFKGATPAHSPHSREVLLCR